MKKWIIIILVLAGLGAIGLLIAKRAGKVQEAREEQKKPIVLPPTPVTVEAAKPHDFINVIEVSGEVRAKRTVNVFAKVGGRIEELTIGLGDKVTQGQLLAKVEDNDLGWREKQGLAGERAASAMVKQAAAQVDVIRTEYERSKKLFEDKVLPEADFTRVAGQLRAAQAALGAAQAQVDVARAGSGLAKEARSWTSIESPIDGVVTRKYADLGGTVGGQPPQPVFELQDQSSLEIRVDVPALALDAVKIGTIVEFEVEERPGKRFVAAVAAVGKSLDPQTRRIRVELSVDGALVEEGVLPSMLATVIIKTGERKGLLAVSKAAIVTLAEGPVVFVVKDGKAKRVVPDVAGADRTHVPVPDLAVGDQVVVAGQDSLRDGTEVKIEVATPTDLPPAAGAAPPGDAAKVPTVAEDKAKAAAP